MSKEVEISDLNEKELDLYLAERLSKFKFTIATCAIYGFLAVFLLLVAFFTSWGNRVLYGDLAAFVFTFILGTVLIIIYLANEIHNFAPKKLDNKISYDSEMCPDYWKLENVKAEDLLDSSGKMYTSKDTNPNHFKYRCVLDEGLFSASKFMDYDSRKASAHRKGYTVGSENNLFVKINDKSNTGISDDNQFEKFKELAANMNGYTYENSTLTPNNELAMTDGAQGFDGDNVPLSCDSVYPLYMSINDRDNAEKNYGEPSNKYRCAYAKKCGIAWSEAGCV